MRARMVLVSLACAAPLGGALADSATGLGSKSVAGASGAAIYQHVCQGCHQEGGRGAKGAGAFPALAGDAHLEEAGYPLGRVLEGHGGMPWFNGVLTDAQIADVINYVRTNFGNHYTDMLTPADVAAAKGPAPILER